MSAAVQGAPTAASANPLEMTRDAEGLLDDTNGCDGTHGTMHPFMLRVHGGGTLDSGMQIPPEYADMDSHVLDAAPRARLTEEERLEREVSRRRTEEMERRTRIFDAKRRTIGVDKEFLDKQCIETCKRKELQKQADREADRAFLGVNQYLSLKEKEKNEELFRQEKESKEYSLRHLNFESRREFDLNDPKRVIKSTPARISDTDPRCGPASMQKFEGEDLGREERERQQKFAMTNSIEQQIYEKRMLEKMRADPGGFDQQVKEILDLRSELERENVAERKAILKSNQHDIVQSMEGKREQMKVERLQEEKVNAKELEFATNSHFLQESEPHIRSNGHVAPSLYKGATREEREEGARQLYQQAREDAERRARQGANDHDINQDAEMARKKLVALEREKQKTKRAMAEEVARHNQAMVAQRKDAQKAAGADGHKNSIGPGFFEQFGVGTR